MVTRRPFSISSLGSCLAVHVLLFEHHSCGRCLLSTTPPLQVLERYSWTQQLADVQIVVPVPPGTKTRDLKVIFTMSQISVGLKGSEPLLGGKFHKNINLDESFWTLEDGKEVSNGREEVVK